MRIRVTGFEVEGWYTNTREWSVCFLLSCLVFVCQPLTKTRDTTRKKVDQK